MKYVAVIDARYCCTSSDDGIRTQRLGCSHRTPREAAAHTAPVYVSPTRSEERSPNPHDAPAARVDGRSFEEPGPFVDRPSLTTGALTGSSRAPLVPDIEPGRAGARPRLLDLFCGAGGAAMGYHRAGFDVVGVDINPQPHYPFEFHQGDAMTWPLDGFDAIHASPPCQAYSVTRHSHDKSHPELIDDVRPRLEASGVPWVMENVVGAPLRNPLVLCGTMFDLCADDPTGLLFLRRHRLFESGYLIFLPRPCRCVEWKRAGIGIGGVYGGGSSDRAHAKNVRRGGYTPGANVRRSLMGIDWTTQDELSQAIPPAYTEWIGTQLLAALRAVA